MIYTHLAAALIAAALAWSFQGARSDAALAELRLEHSDTKLAAVSKARAEEREDATQYQEALNAARTRESTLRRAADAARSERERLRDDLAAANARLSTASAASVAEYAATAAGLLDQCAGAYQELARAADGHASDIRTVIGAWPR